MAIGTDILVVEDSPMQAEQLRGVLEANGHRVAAVRGGREALVAIRQRRPTLVITDIVMPEMGGYELCRQIKRDAELHDIPVMLMTSLSDPVDLIRGLECGADSFSVKPWEEGQLMARIAGISANRQLQAVDRAQRGIEIVFRNKKFLISSDRFQVLNFLLASYETAVDKHAALESAQNELVTLNEQLEDTVRVRTAALEAEFAERMRAQEALRKTEERHRLALATTSDGIWDANLRDGTVHFNERYVAAFGAPAENEEPWAWWTDHVHPDDRDRTVSSFNAAVNGSGDVWKCEYRLRRTDGTWADADDRAHITRDGAGKAEYVIGALSDITERKGAEKAIASQLLELQRWQDVMLGHEDRVQSLKREVNELCRRAGMSVRYPSQEAGSADCSRAPTTR